MISPYLILLAIVWAFGAWCGWIITNLIKISKGVELSDVITDQEFENQINSLISKDKPLSLEVQKEVARVVNNSVRRRLKEDQLNSGGEA